MTDPLDPPAEPEPSRDPSDPADNAASGTPVSTATVFQTGVRWENYELGECIESGTISRFHAVDASSMESVILRLSPIDTSTEIRRQVFTLLQDLAPGNHLPLLRDKEINGQRVEVTAAPPKLTLRDWLVEHPANRSTVEQFVQQLAPVLYGMHTRGVVHLNLRPETIFVDNTGDKVQYLVGGLDEAVPHTQSGLISAGVDAFYAPPEAAGLFRHPPGQSLCAWDWWSFGRVIQEYVLGRHVLGYHLNRDLSRITPELRLRAEDLLFEREPAGIRAGAVELMAGADPAIIRLLRGLLTGSRDVRWRMAELEGWLHGQSTTDRYDLPRNVRLFTWKGQSYTVAEAADHFAQEAHWEDGESNLFESTHPDGSTLLSFVCAETVHSAVAARLQTVVAKTDLPAWQTVPLAARRTALAAAAWCACVAPGEPAALRIKGRRLDWIGLQAWVASSTGGEIAPLLDALTTKPYIDLVETLDGEAARALTTLGQHARPAIDQAIKEQWIQADDAEARAAIYRLAAKTPRELEASLAALRTRFATTHTPILADYFATKGPERWKVLLLLHTSDQPDRFRYVSRQEHHLEHHRTLEKELVRLSALLFWLRLRRTFICTPWFFAPPWILGTVWAGLAVALYLKFNDALIPATLLAALVGVRVLAQLHLRRLVAPVMSGATRPWGWTDSAARCRTEIAALAVPENSTPRLDALSKQVRALVREMADIPLEPKPLAARPLPSLAGIWTGAALAPLVMVAGLAQLLIAEPKPKTPPLTGPESLVSATPTPTPEPEITFVPPPPGSPPGLYEEVRDGFGRRVRGPLQTWDVPQERQGHSVTVRRRTNASPDQTAHALIDGERILRPYPTKGVPAVIAVRVPDDTTVDIGLMLFDGRKRCLVSAEVVVVDAVPEEKAWTQLGTHRVVYLGVPNGASPPPVRSEFNAPLPELPPIF